MLPMLNRIAACILSVLACGTPSFLYAADHPVVPFSSFFNHWDHHWYVWLRGDSTYEAVEVMSRDRGQNASPLVWVFFTERAPPKKQTSYVNDKRVAAAIGWEFRDIVFSRSGPSGESQSLSVSLRDLQDRPVSIEVDRDPAVPLSRDRGGLTNQIGHSGEQVVLLFFREQGARSRAARVTIAGVDVSQPRPEADYVAPFNSSYSSNIMVGGFPFGDREATFGDLLNTNSAATQFTRKEDSWVATRADRTTVELKATGTGDLEAYLHRDGNNNLAVRFEPPIPSDARLVAGFSGRFFVGYDQFGDLASGRLTASLIPGGWAIDWTFETPDWLKGRAMRTLTTSADGQIVRVNLQAVATAPPPAMKP
jgi:hypothetical protein